MLNTYYNVQVRKYVYLLFAQYFLVIAAGISNYKLQNIQPSATVVTPKGNTYSVLASASSFEMQQNVVYGFLPYWTLEKAENIQMDKLTDIAYFGLHIDKSGKIIKLDEDGTTAPGYNHWRNSDTLTEVIQKAKMEGVRVALTVMSHNDETSDAFLNCTACWKTLAEELETEMTYRNVKHLNLDFEYVEYPRPEIAARYTELTAYLNKYLDQKFGDSFVVVSTFADSVVKTRVTEIVGLSRATDALFIMAYDFHHPTSDNAGPVSPISIEGEKYDIEQMIQDYLTIAAPGKLIMGVPYYGYNWVVTGEDAKSERIDGNENIGFSQSQTYEAIIDTLLETNAEVLWDEEAKVPYFSYVSNETGSNRQVYFENTKSLQYKYQLAKQNKFGGVGIWALGYDGGYQELWDLLSQEFPNTTNSSTADTGGRCWDRTNDLCNVNAAL